jgi:hypothetical protein
VPKTEEQPEFYRLSLARKRRRCHVVTRAVSKDEYVLRKIDLTNLSVMLAW